MRVTVRHKEAADNPEVLAIAKHYALNSFASFWDREPPADYGESFLGGSPGYPFLVAEVEGQVAGFAMLRPFHRLPSFRATAEIIYFLGQDYTRQGLGGKLLARLEELAREMGLNHLVALISSFNQPSQQFHLSHGFTERGRLLDIGRKLGQNFGVVYMQKTLE